MTEDFCAALYIRDAKLQCFKHDVMDHFSSFQPTNFTNPVYATLYMGAHNSRNSLASTDEKKELLSRGDEEPLVDPLA